MYKLGLLDPPWKYDNQQQNDPARGGIVYPTLSMQDLYEIPLHKAFDKDSVLLMWVTFPKLLDQYYEKYDPTSIMRNWGFRPVTAAFVWVKLNRKADIQNEGADPYWEEDKNDANEYAHIRMDAFYSGLGRYTNSNAEICLLGRRGKGLPRVEKNVKQLIFAPIGTHSAKPQKQYRRIERLFGEATPETHIELFARRENPPPTNWSATGLDYDGLDIRQWIKQYGE